MQTKTRYANCAKVSPSPQTGLSLQRSRSANWAQHIRYDRSHLGGSLVILTSFCRRNTVETGLTLHVEEGRSRIKELGRGGVGVGCPRRSSLDRGHRLPRPSIEVAVLHTCSTTLQDGRLGAMSLAHNDAVPSTHRAQLSTQTRSGRRSRREAVAILYRARVVLVAAPHSRVAKTSEHVLDRVDHTKKPRELLRRASP